MPSPLDGITILDLTIYQNGAWATVMLSDMGADVIKVEPPGRGDPGRDASVNGSQPGEVYPYLETMNRNKRSLTLDLKSDEGREVFYRLARSADVVTQNFRVGVVEKLGVDYDTLHRLNPKLVYASVSGYGPEGPDAKQGVFDILGMARGGLMSLLSAPHPEMGYWGGGLSDQTGAITLAYGVLLGLMARERHGVGQHVQTSQLAGQLLLQALGINRYLLSGQEPRVARRGQRSQPLFTSYRCADERWLVLGCVELERYWEPVCRALGIERYLEDPSYATPELRRTNGEQFARILDEVFASRARDVWIPLLRERGVLCSAVQTYADLPDDPQVSANDYLIELEHPEHGMLRQVGLPVRLSETPGAARCTAPALGAHTEEVLRASGYDAEAIAGLRARGVI